MCWDEDELLDTPVSPFQDESAVDQQRTKPWVFPNQQPVKWRLLQGQKGPEQGSGTNATCNEDTRFLTSGDLTVNSTPIQPTATFATAQNDDDDSDLSQFYDHSYAVHENSAVQTSESFSRDSIIRESGSWAASTGTSVVTASDIDASSPSSIPIHGPLSNLGEVPNAKYLRSIVPQTMTVNLVVGVITVNPPRRVVTRAWKRELDIVELVVGDETRTGFGVTFWLSPKDDSDGLRKTLMTLRPCDIVLLRTVALSSFQERVYGQSLRKGFTKVDLLHRQPVDSTDAVGIYSLKALQHDGSKDDLLQRTCKVREWILRFVGYPADNSNIGGGHGRPGGRVLSHHDRMLPPDTQ